MSKRYSKPRKAVPWSPEEKQDVFILTPDEFLHKYPSRNKDELRAAKQRANGYNIEPSAWGFSSLPPQPPRKSVAVLTMSDIHYGKETRSYDPDVAFKRLRSAGEQLIRLRDGNMVDAVDELRIILLGDVVDGADIFPGQAHEQAITDPVRQCEELAAILESWIRAQKPIWPTINVECVPGNHGRLSKHAHTQANWDRVCYDLLRHRLRQSGVIVYRNEHPDPQEIRLTPITEKRSLLITHGHILGAGGQPNEARFRNPLNNWWADRHYGPFDVAVFGHWHQSKTWEANRWRAFFSGTLVTDDTYVFNKTGQREGNEWWLIGMNDTSPRPAAWYHPIYVGG